MNEKWLKKFVRNCLLQYGRDVDEFPFTESEWADLSHKIILEKQKQPNSDLYEIVHDILYEYLTK
ncbi:YqzH family protein [Anoxybacteroides tepidamans]|uniref:YqzH family protein n=1 Tax=Anoxybacteroides tepidamans TaxID=265948 RepID=UPI00048937CC|nr:YqzH family protein [Anoxybacillus tepidamans]